MIGWHWSFFQFCFVGRKVFFVKKYPHKSKKSDFVSLFKPTKKHTKNTKESELVISTLQSVREFALGFSLWFDLPRVDTICPKGRSPEIKHQKKTDKCRLLLFTKCNDISVPRKLFTNKTKPKEKEKGVFFLHLFLGEKKVSLVLTQEYPHKSKAKKKEQKKKQKKQKKQKKKANEKKQNKKTLKMTHSKEIRSTQSKKKFPCCYGGDKMIERFLMVVCDIKSFQILSNQVRNLNWSNQMPSSNWFVGLSLHNSTLGPQFWGCSSFLFSSFLLFVQT